MYLVGDYFVECLTNHIPGGGWTGTARITRRDDWRKLAEVPKALFVGLPDCPTKQEAEEAAIRWARERVLKHRNVIEKALEDGCINGAADGGD